MIRLVALDIDGTLLDSSNRLSDGNAAAIREALAQGAQVVLATSRWRRPRQAWRWLSLSPRPRPWASR